MKVLFHCHTEISPCSNLKEGDLVAFLDKNNFDAVVVTDHNVITRINWPRGLVIPGSELATADGDVIGLFMTKDIPRGLSIQETSKRIHAQGGLVVAAHPADKLRREAMGTTALMRNLKYFDIIEGFNSRNLFNASNSRALEIAKEHGIPTITGSDAHTIGELPNTYMEMPRFSNATEFMRALSDATAKTKASGPIPHAKTVIIKLTKKIAQQQKRQ